jgi:hypothetical protein
MMSYCFSSINIHALYAHTDNFTGKYYANLFQFGGLENAHWIELINIIRKWK